VSRGTGDVYGESASISRARQGQTAPIGRRDGTALRYHVWRDLVFLAFPASPGSGSTTSQNFTSADCLRTALQLLAATAARFHLSLRGTSRTALSARARARALSARGSPQQLCGCCLEQLCPPAGEARPLCRACSLVSQGSSLLSPW